MTDNAPFRLFGGCNYGRICVFYAKTCSPEYEIRRGIFEEFMPFNGKYPLTPAEDAAYLLRRVAALILVFAMPLTALVSRRSFTILFPFGVVLLGLAFFLDMKKEELSLRLWRFVSHPMVYVMCGFVAWLVLSLPWASFYGVTWGKVLGLSTLVMMTMIGAFVLPNRTPEALASHMAWSFGILGICAFLSNVFPILPESAFILERVFVILALFVWGACSGFLLLDKPLHAFGLLGLSLIGIFLSDFQWPKILFALGLLCVVLLSFIPPSRLIPLSLYGIIGTLLLTPVFLWLISAFSFILGTLAQRPFFTDFLEWKARLFETPLQLIMGHGLGAWNHVQAMHGTSYTFSPTLFVTLWYDLGLIGVIAQGLIIWSVFSAIREISHEILRGAALVTFYSVLAYTYAWSGVDKLWWFSILGALTLFFVAMGRLQNAAVPLKVTFRPRE
jgi:hypothetical protein